MSVRAALKTKHDGTLVQEPRWHSALAVAIALGLYMGLPGRLALGPTWVLPLLEGLLLVGLMATSPHPHPNESRAIRSTSISLIGLINLANIASLVLLVHALFQHQVGRPLLISAAQIWLTSVMIFGLWYWEIDRGGPGARAHEHPVRRPDFLFPQMDVTRVAPTNWRPRFFDYLYVSFTNSMAFSPTDAMPLTGLPKALMLVQSLSSIVTVVLVTARAVNVL